MDDVRAAVCRGGEAVGIGDVADCELGADRLCVRAALRRPDKYADVAALRAQGVHDPWADEPRPPGDENLHFWKFCQYLLGVGPRWPWYFEPSDELPYGADAGSDICMKETCPIFMP